MKAIVPERFERGRLTYERIDPEHAADLKRLMLEPRVLATLWPWETKPTDADLHASLRAMLEQWERHGFGIWLLRERSSDELIGRGGLQHCTVEGRSAVEAAWAVMPQRWGEGFATELAHTSVEVAFGGLHLHELIAFTLPHNLASRRVMEKSGFEYERDIEHAGLPHVLYRHPPPTEAD